MTTEREEALDLRREARESLPEFTRYDPEEVLIALVRLAKQRGAEEQKRKDAELLERQHTWITSVAASALIRNQQ